METETLLRSSLDSGEAARPQRDCLSGRDLRYEHDRRDFFLAARDNVPLPPARMALAVLSTVHTKPLYSEPDPEQCDSGEQNINEIGKVHDLNNVI